jgi:hypothetical protein
MAIKGQLARLERHLAKSGQRVFNFVIPYCRDKKKLKDLKHCLLIQYNLTELQSLRIALLW